MASPSEVTGPVLLTALVFAGAGLIGHPFPWWTLALFIVGGVMFIAMESR